jgi:hypothetical protein
LKKEAYAQRVDSESQLSFHAWETKLGGRSPTFRFWDMMMRYETMILMFVRAHREKCFSLYVQVLEELVHLFFALDHVNYARWVPIHLRDMRSLPVSMKKELFLRHAISSR